MGANVTEGLGAGSKPEIGAAAAEEAMADIKAHLAGCHMVFITAGMGGGTGTGAAPVIARASREEGILTVGVVTKPFQFEGQRRMRAAEAGIVELQKYVDTLLIIPNQNLFRVANEKTTFADAFAMADDVLRVRRRLHHRPHGQGRADQSRLRRRPHHHGRHGQGDDGHRRIERRPPRDRGRRSRDLQSAARRCVR